MTNLKNFNFSKEKDQQKFNQLSIKEKQKIIDESHRQALNMQKDKENFLDTQYDHIAEKYTRNEEERLSKKYVFSYTFFKILGDIKNKKILESISILETWNHSI